MDKHVFVAQELTRTPLMQPKPHPPSGPRATDPSAHTCLCLSKAEWACTHSCCFKSLCCYIWWWDGVSGLSYQDHFFVCVKDLVSYLLPLFSLTSYALLLEGDGCILCEWGKGRSCRHPSWPSLSCSTCCLSVGSTGPSTSLSSYLHPPISSLHFHQTLSQMSCVLFTSVSLNGQVYSHSTYLKFDLKTSTNHD